MLRIMQNIQLFKMYFTFSNNYIYVPSFSNAYLQLMTIVAWFVELCKGHDCRNCYDKQTKECQITLQFLCNSIDYTIMNCH